MLKVARAVLLLAGILAIPMGLLWIGQGLGLIMWPASSFMLGAPEWSVNGTALVVTGMLAVWLARRGRVPRP